MWFFFQRHAVKYNESDLVSMLGCEINLKQRARSNYLNLKFAKWFLTSIDKKEPLWKELQLCKHLPMTTKESMEKLENTKWTPQEKKQRIATKKTS